VLTIRSDQMKAMGGTNQLTIVPCPQNATWVEIELLDDQGNPVGGARYSIELPDGSVHNGTLDSQGVARYDGIIPGACSINFPDYDGKDWHRK